jgi:hypothetical protein
MKTNLVVKEDASESILTVLIWSVASLLSTRLYLKLMNYPEIGGGTWHVSHAAIGGVIMIIGVILMLVFVGKKMKNISLIIFGMGTGLFIDEIGKYLSKDNNYFFRPAIIVMYVFFVCLFLISRYLKRFLPKDNRAIFYSVLNRMEEVANDDLEKNEKKIIEYKLKEIIKTEKTESIKLMADGMLTTLQKIRAKSDKSVRVWRKQISKIFQISYDKFFRRKLIMIGLWGYSIYYAIDKISDILRISTSQQKMMMIEKFYTDFNFFGKSDVYMIVGQMVFDVIASVLFLLGARYFWSKKRLRGIRFFKYGLYVSLLLGSIFRFYFEQFGAISDLVLGIVILEMLNQYRREIVAK